MSANRSRRVSRKIYGSGKIREMQRSILPSDRRRDARKSLDRVRRAGRRTIASLLVVYRGDARSAIERALDDADDLDAWPQHRIRDEVFERRYHDKVAPLMRWAVARTRALPQEDRLDALRGVLPSGLIGRHALSHLDGCREIHNPCAPRPWGVTEVREASPSDLLEPVVRAAYEDGRHAEINRWMKRQRAVGSSDVGGHVLTDVSLLRGQHDIERFSHSLGPELASRLIAHLRKG